MLTVLFHFYKGVMSRNSGKRSNFSLNGWSFLLNSTSFFITKKNLEFRVAWLILFLWPWKERGWGNSHLLIYEFIQQQKLPDLSLLVWREIRTCWVSVSVLCCCVQNSLILPPENSLTPSQTVDYNGHN